jgi:hypothetical protein
MWARMRSTHSDRSDSVEFCTAYSLQCEQFDQTSLGYAYFKGKGVKSDYKEAAKLLSGLERPRSKETLMGQSIWAIFSKTGSVCRLIMHKPTSGFK